MMAFFRFVFVANVASSFLVGGSQILHESPTEMFDEITLLQAAASSKSAAAIGGAEEAKASSCQDFGGICSEPEVSFDFAVDGDLAPLDVPLNKSAAQVLESHDAEPDPELVAIIRQALWLVSAAIAFNGAMKWQPQKARKSRCNRAVAPCVSKSREVTSSAPQRSSLHKAALAGDDARCELLLRRAPDTLATPDNWGTTALHAAASGGSRLVVELLLERGAPMDPVNSWDETPLHLAARGGHVKVCQLLVRNGASLHAVNAEDRTPLVVAGFEEQDETCRSLLALGAHVGGLSEQDLPEFLRELMAR